MNQRKNKNLLIISIGIFILIISVVAAEATWINIPSVFDNSYDFAGPDGVRGTSDDLTGRDGQLGTADDYGADLIVNTLDDLGPDMIFGTPDDPILGYGIFSGYSGGTFESDGSHGIAEGTILTADVSMISEVYKIGGGDYFYFWMIENTGSGPFIEYWDTGRGPNFLQNPPLFQGQSEIDTLIGGRPIVGQWGGRWNPEISPTVSRYVPVPEPATMLLLCSGFIGLAGFRRKLKKKG